MADNDETEDPQRAALKELVQSRGWQLLKEYAAQRHGPAGYGREMQAALASVAAGPDRPYELARIAEQVDSTARAVNALMKWPEEQIQQLTPKKPVRFAGLRGITR